MSFHFATCERGRALQFLKDVYPSSIIEDSPESAGPLLDLVAADIVRIQDPMMHGKSPQIIPGTYFDESQRERVHAVAIAFHEKVTQP